MILIDFNKLSETFLLQNPLTAIRKDKKLFVKTTSNNIVQIYTCNTKRLMFEVKPKTAHKIINVSFKDAHTLIITYENGLLTLVDTQYVGNQITSLINLKKEFKAHALKVTAICFLNNQVIIGDAKGYLYQFDLQTSKATNYFEENIKQSKIHNQVHTDTFSSLRGELDNLLNLK